MEKQTTLSNSEWIIMEQLWMKSHTLMELVVILGQRVGWSKSTVATMVRRMEEKGVIIHTEQGRYIIAQILGVYSQVPGGLGVFELVFSNIIPDTENQAILFGALIAYRIIYYLLPLIISAIALISYEGYLRYRQNKIKKQYKLVKIKEFISQKACKIKNKI